MSLITLTAGQIVELKRPTLGAGGMVRVDQDTHYGVAVGTYSGNPGSTGVWAVTKVSGAVTFEVTKAGAAGICIYKDTADKKYYIQNNTAGTLTMTIQYQAVMENIASL